MKTIYLLCIHNVRTGGPEAIHQLSDALISQGFDARIVYYDRAHIAMLEHGPIDPEGYRFSDAPEFMRCQFEEYAHYATRIESAVPNSPDAVVVLPEAICHLAPKFNQAPVLIWWLSVDNAFGALSRVNLNHLRAENVRHVWQSRYAERFIEALGLRNEGELSDYTVDLAQYAPILPRAARRKLVAINTNDRKVIANWPALIVAVGRIDPEIEFEVVKGGRAEIASLFGRARLYLDLGSFPGKDRMPREAASMNCEPLVLEVGAGASDFEVEWGTDGRCVAARIVKAVNSDAEWNWAAGYVAERDQFFDEVRELFSEEQTT